MFSVVLYVRFESMVFSIVNMIYLGYSPALFMNNGIEGKDMLKMVTEVVEKGRRTKGPGWCFTFFLRSKTLRMTAQFWPN